MFLQLSRTTLDILMLRKGPQDLPSDWGLLAALALAYCSLTFAQVRLVSETGQALYQSVLATGLLALFAHVVLRLRGMPARFVQTATALFAVGSLLTLLMLGPITVLAPFFQAVAESGGNADSFPEPPGFALLVYMLIGIWGLVVAGHIYRHALELHLVMGVGVALLYEVVLFMTFTALGAGAT